MANYQEEHVASDPNDGNYVNQEPSGVVPTAEQRNDKTAKPTAKPKAKPRPSGGAHAAKVQKPGSASKPRRASKKTTRPPQGPSAGEAQLVRAGKNAYLWVVQPSTIPYDVRTNQVNKMWATITPGDKAKYDGDPVKFGLAVCVDREKN
ncbi:hypothetical protein E8E13_003540 [Curvularia kusanoi]|uniref:Uncharacterized protein n=1 Tax=Curvularia kusanoi TaxID=90978 RepID=A0A9P4TKD8_CURKU|nr:hypothetical protein E8E13_003540 [Curvularia kusanoi]